MPARRTPAVKGRAHHVQYSAAGNVIHQLGAPPRLNRVRIMIGDRIDDELQRQLGGWSQIVAVGRWVGVPERSPFAWARPRRRPLAGTAPMGVVAPLCNRSGPFDIVIGVTSKTFDDVVPVALPGLLRYAAALTGDREQAQDLVQDVLARAFEKWQRVERADNVQAYLTRMLTNEFLSWRRRSFRRVVTVPDDVLPLVASEDHVGDLVARADLRRRLASLPRRQSVAIVLRYYLGFADSDSAAVLGCTESTVRSLCSRGLSALRLEAEAVSPLAVAPAHPLLGKATS